MIPSNSNFHKKQYGLSKNEYVELSEHVFPLQR